MAFIAAFAAALSLQPGFAQTVPPGGNLNGVAATNGAVWDLQGDAFLSNGVSASAAKALPAGVPGLTINGAPAGSTITMSDGAGHYGFFSGGPSTLNLTNVSIVGGSEVTGGAISLTGALTVNGDLAVNNNSATNGSGGAVAVTTGGVTVNGGLVANGNTSGTAFPNIVLKGGGAIYVGIGDVAVSGSTTLNANTTTAVNTNTGAGFGPGGAIYAANGNVRLGTAGGNVTLTDNISSSSGGAIFAGGGAASNVSLGAAGSTLTITGNRAGFTPGGALVPGNSSGGAISNTAGTTTLFGNAILFANNQATSNGGAIASAKVVATGDVIAIGNTLTGGNGGFINAGTGGVSIFGSLTANNNIGATSGGVIFTTGPILVTGNVSLDNNIAASVFNGLGNGGAIATTGAASDVRLATTGGDVSITNNKGSWSGGGIIAGGNFVAGNISSQVNITGNMAGYRADGTQLPGSIAFGGGLRVFGTITLNGASVNVSDNTASANGGGIYSNSSVTVNGPLVANNNLSAFGIGGGIYSLAGDVTTNANVSMSGNVAGNGNGGAIYINNGSAVISTTSGNVSLTNNTSALDGGAISAAGSGNVTVGNLAAVVTLSGNKAGFDATGAPVNALGHGGAIFAVGVTSITGLASTISNNQATLEGGGIYSVGAFTLNAGGPMALNGNIAGGNGGAIWSGSNVTLNATDGDITFSGNLHNGTQANAIYLSNVGGATTTTFNTAAGRTIAFFDPVQSNAANGLVSVIKTDAGTVAFDGSRHTVAGDRWSQIYGATQVQTGRFVVNNDAVYGVLATDVGQITPSSFVVSPGVTLAGGVAGTVRADAFTLGGTLDIAGTAVGTVGNLFTIASNNVSFSAGSRVLFNTFLGTDGSPSDLLTLNLNGSATSGQAAILVKNVGGGGDLTTGNGIQLVQTNNGTSADAFTLGARAVAGPYEYTLFRGSVDASGPENWYLRSTLDCALAPNDPICQPPGPGPGPTPPNFRRETSLYATLPSMALLYGRTLLDTLHERVGDEEDLRNQPRQNGIAAGAWARVIGQHGSNAGDPLGIFGSGPKFDYNIGAFQGGQDLLRREGADGSRDNAGLYAAIGLLTGDVTHFDRTFAGANSLNAYSLGGYWTHFGATGWYLDAILQGTWYDVRSASTTLPALTNNGWGVASSLEAGYPVHIGGGFVIEPQAQIVYQNISLGDGNDTAATVRFRNIDSLAARVGARLARTWSLNDGNQPRSITAWIRPSLWNEFRGDPQTLFSSAKGPVLFQSDLGGAWVELNAGLDAKITAATSLFASAGYQVSINGNMTAYNGKAGFRMAW